MSDNSRQHVRVRGPFDGRRIGMLDTPVQIYDLSEGGCFVNCLQEQPGGREVVLEIALPNEGAVTVTAQSLYSRSGFGFAARFTQVEPEVLEKLRRQVARLQAEGARTS
jgi:hypothetical protein